MFCVVSIAVTGERRSYVFASERKARWYVNDHADGVTLFVLYDPAGEVVVESRFPVLLCG
jgi:hypothetical protein